MIGLNIIKFIKAFFYFVIFNNNRGFCKQSAKNMAIFIISAIIMVEERYI